MKAVFGDVGPPGGGAPEPRSRPFLLGWGIDSGHLVRGTRTRLTFDEKEYLNPLFVPDGESVLASAGTGSPNTYAILRISVDGGA